MLQVDHIYEFLYQELFKDFEFSFLPNGIVKNGSIDFSDIMLFTHSYKTTKKIFFYDQEPLLKHLSEKYLDINHFPCQYTLEEISNLNTRNAYPYNIEAHSDELITYFLANPDVVYKKRIVVTSEHSELFKEYAKKYNFTPSYYFFHGFAALDWYRGFYALNYNKSIIKQYTNDYISFNRIITNDRSYRIYFVSQLKAQGLLDHGLVSFGVTDDTSSDWRDEVADPKTKLSEYARSHVGEHLINVNKLVIDHHEIHGSASANIPRTIERIDYYNDTLNMDSFWHIVTETVFYYNKLHLTEKIFKPIVSKQPFMLLAAPGNLAYLKSYGFKTFDSVIDESYDGIVDNDLRTEAVVHQLRWYCNLTPGEKTDVIKQLEPIIQHNFDHFYGEFRHIIANELLDNTKTVFKEIGYNDSHINYTNIHHVLTH